MDALNSSLFKFKIPSDNSQSSGSEYSDSGSEEMDAFKGLPVEVSRRVYALEHLQDKRRDLETEFRKELAILEKKYEDLYSPIYDDRKKIVNGEREVTEEEYKDREPSHIIEENEAASVSGIPNFWLDVLVRSQLESLVFDNDHDALKHLTNIKSERFIDAEAPKLIVSFEFASNPYFTNAVLSKSVVFNATGDSVMEVNSTPIEWKEDQNLCFSFETKTLRHRSKPGVSKTKESKVELPSFFHFFDNENLSLEHHDHDDSEECGQGSGCDRMMADAEICSFLDKYIIPNAVDWYTFKADYVDDCMDDEYSDYEQEESDEE